MTDRHAGEDPGAVPSRQPVGVGWSGETMGFETGANAQVGSVEFTARDV
jgi:hypothetical protein